jgi:hypothetical protein
MGQAHVRPGLCGSYTRADQVGVKEHPQLEADVSTDDPCVAGLLIRNYRLHDLRIAAPVARLIYMVQCLVLLPSKLVQRGR